MEYFWIKYILDINEEVFKGIVKVENRNSSNFLYGAAILANERGNTLVRILIPYEDIICDATKAQWDGCELFYKLQMKESLYEVLSENVRD